MISEAGSCKDFRKVEYLKLSLGRNNVLVPSLNRGGQVVKVGRDRFVVGVRKFAFIYLML